MTGSEDGTLKIWDIRSATVQRNFDHKSPVNDCVIHPNQGELVSCDQSGAIKWWDLAQNLCTHELVRLFYAASVTRETDRIGWATHSYRKMMCLCDL